MTVGAAHAASADQFTFVEGTSTYTWQEAASPSTLNPSSSNFTLADVAGSPGSTLEFWVISQGGGFTSTIADFYSDQVFSGSTSAPTFTLGTFSGLDHNTGAEATLTISAVSAVPEAGNAAMLLAGLGLMGVVARRRSAANRA